MKLEVRRDAIRVIPETFEDVAYIEDTLGLKKCGGIPEACKSRTYGTR